MNLAGCLEVIDEMMRVAASKSNMICQTRSLRICMGSRGNECSKYVEFMVN